ncbi:hypothetical protein SEVIR_6G068800v4 [Setaria viridis]|uniref:uncharacterized protein isoform X3 n=1 Tax=Setaria viridis TaxID=4556 RepID=UPI001493A11B|nr:uncharacterized protein LOC117861118 isoform X3 [Setaria viridis]
MEDLVHKEVDALRKILTDTSGEPIKLSYATIDYLVGDFSDEDCVIGRGGFGVVYMGTLWDAGSPMKVAIKKLNSTSPSFDDEQFVKEVRCLKMAKHKNIVQFLGYCADTANEVMELPDGKHVLVEALRQRLLCFKYAPNGSLDHFINKGNFHAMDWTTRYQIIKGICQGLQYLHENRINHLDLKPENVLLDIDMEPKITDFGLSRCFDEKQSRIQTNNICGTPGYIAPEIIDCGDVSYKSDIYSLGVIISKLSTGCSMPGANYSSISHEHLQHMMKRVDELAKSCGDDDQHKRPNINELLCKLDEIESEIETVIRVNGTSIDQEPLYVHPRKLVWPLAANSSMPFSLHLTNKSTDDHFAFMFLDFGGVASSCSILGNKGVIPPQSTWGIVLHLQLQAGESAVSEKQGKEMVIVRSTVVEKGFRSNDITVDMFKRHLSVQDIELEVIFVEPPQSQPLQLYEFDHKLQLDANRGTSHGTTQTCPDESIMTELLDIYPFEVGYPPKPEKFCTRTIHLTNTTEDTVQFWMVPSANARYYTNEGGTGSQRSKKVPDRQLGFVPPQSTYAVSWLLWDEKCKPTNTESFEILMVTRTDVGHLSGIKGYPGDFDEQVFNAARDKGGKAHRACLFVDNNSGPDKNYHRYERVLVTKYFGEITSMDVHPTTLLVLTGHQNFVCIWRTEKWQNHVTEHARGFKDAMDFVVKFIARMQWVLSGDKTGKVNVYTTELKLLHTFTAHSDQVISIAVHPNHPYVLTSSDDLLIKLWNWDNAWTCTREFQGHLNPATQVVFNPNDNADSFASCSRASYDCGRPGNVKIWRIDSTNPETDLYGGFRAIDWSAPVKDGQYLVAIVERGYTEIWDMEKQRCVHSIICAGVHTQVACHPTLPIVVAGDEKGVTRIINLNTFRVEYIIPAVGNDPLIALGFSDIAGYKSY